MLFCNAGLLYLWRAPKLNDLFLNNMNLDGIKAMMAMVPPPQGTQENPTAAMLKMLGTFGIMAFIFYFILIRPQQKKQKEHDKMMQSLKPGNKVVTASGIIGVVVSIKDKSVTIRSADTKMEVLRSAVSDIIEKEASES